MRRNALGKVAGCLMGGVFSLKSFVGLVQALIEPAPQEQSCDARCSYCAVQAEPHSMYLRSRRRRERDRRHVILQAQAQKLRAKRLFWHRPRDVVAGATGQGDVSYVAPETIRTGCGDPPSAFPSCDTSPKPRETTNLKVNTLDGGSIDLTSSGLESISYVGMSSVDATWNTESGDRFIRPSHARN